MPRDRQAPAAPNDQAYGMRGDQIAAQQAIPLPQTQAPGMQPTEPQQPSMIDQARQFDPGITPLTAPTSRPGEPVTSGLPMGAGPGPEIFSTPARAHRTADVLLQLADLSGTDRWREMAERIRAAGGMR